jgi:hypothetical protein
MSSYRVEDNSIDGVQPLLKLLQHFFPYAQKQLGFHKPVMISFQSDEDNANKLLGRTGYYNPDEFSIAIYVDGRHPKDVLRSLSHELIHHTQNCNGEFDAMEDLGPGYAQENPAMRDAELDAYKRGNIILRDFEDLIKKGEINVDIDFEELGEPRMSLKEWKNNELNMLLLKKWGLLKEGALPSYRDDDKEHDDEEGNRPSMAKDMDLDEQDEPDDKKKAGDRIGASARDELGSGEVDLTGTGGVARHASEQPPHDRFGKQPPTHPYQSKGVKETITLDEARDLARRIFAKLSEGDQWERSVVADDRADYGAYAKGGGGRVVAGGSTGKRAKDYALMGSDPSQAPIDVEVAQYKAEREAMKAAAADARGGGRVVRGGSQSARARAAERQGIDISMEPESAGLASHWDTEEEKARAAARPRRAPIQQELDPGRPSGAINVRMPPGGRRVREALVNKIRRKLSKEIK